MEVDMVLGGVPLVLRPAAGSLQITLPCPAVPADLYQSGLVYRGCTTLPDSVQDEFHDHTAGSPGTPLCSCPLCLWGRLEAVQPQQQCAMLLAFNDPYTHTTSNRRRLGGPNSTSGGCMRERVCDLHMCSCFGTRWPQRPVTDRYTHLNSAATQASPQQQPTTLHITP